jgi:hypothetical protein
MKKTIKKIDDERFKRIALMSLKKMKQWSNIDHPNSKRNIKILKGNFYRNGKFI